MLCLYLSKVVEQDFNAGFSELPSMMVVRIHKLFKRRPRSVLHLFLNMVQFRGLTEPYFFVMSQSSATRVCVYLPQDSESRRSRRLQPLQNALPPRPSGS